jgi:hypothetical protein
VGGVKVKLALIPPYKYLKWTNTTDYQLMLPQLLWSERYASRYRAHCDDPEQYVILDNGAAEGEEWSFEQLHIIAEEWGIDEVVLPDVMGDAEATFNQAFDIIGRVKSFPFKVGVVATGKSPTEALRMIDDLMVYANRINVIYIPRLLVKEDDIGARLALADAIHSTYPDKEIHFLGASKYFPEEIQSVARQGFVRGMDTSMPFNYAYARTRQDQGLAIERPEDYFQLKFDHFQLETMHYNISLMLGWVNGA